MGKVMLSPFRYPGGKSRFVKTFCEFFEQEFWRLDRAYFYELYAGGASIGLHFLLNNWAERLILNEIDPGVYSFWMALKHDTDRLVNFLSDCPTNYEAYMEMRDYFKTSAGKGYDFKLGCYTIVLNRLSFSGILKTPCPIGGFAQTGLPIDCRFNRDGLIKSIRKIAERKKQIYVTRMDAVEMLSLPFRSDDFVFIDPPYLKGGAKLYRHYYREQDFQRLSDALRRTRANWAMTMEPSDILAEFPSVSRELKYSIVSSKDVKENIYYGKIGA